MPDNEFIDLLVTLDFELIKRKNQSKILGLYEQVIIYHDLICKLEDLLTYIEEY